MKKLCLFITVFVITVASVCAQRSDNSIPQIDNVVNTLIRDVHRKLVEVRATKVVVSQQFLFRGSVPPFSAYWVNQLTGALANTSNRSYILLSDGPAGADFILSGEIVETGDIIRVYTRLIRQDGRAIEASFQSDIERNAATTALLAGGRSGSYVPLDDYEPDSWDNPVSYTIGADENSAPSIARTITENDEDFFLLVPNSNGRLVMETTGDTDTYMEFYDAANRRMLEENDDGGNGNNARIIYNVEAGKLYIAKVRGYNGDVTGSYAFRAFFRIPRVADNRWENPIRYNIGVSQNAAAEIERTLNEEDEDFFLIVPNSSARISMETTGDMDTYMEFYDAGNRRSTLAENDDSGQGYNARITYNVEAGKRYIAKVRGYGGEATGQYAFRAFINPPRADASSWENPMRYDIGANQSVRVTNRVLEEDDEDYFLLVPNRSGNVLIETKGDTDTLLELFDANTRQLLDDDDDSGDEYNAMITYNLEAGKRYIVKVRSYGSSGGEYGFKAYNR
jgi:hypothetical protein